MTNYTVSSGVTSMGVVLSAIDTMNVLSGGIASGTVVNGGSFEVIHSGGVARATTINALGDVDIESGGIASGTIINAGGSQIVDGIASGTVVSSGGTETISGSGQQYGTHVLSGGTLADDINETVGSGQTVSAVDFSSLGAATRTALLSAITLDSGGIVKVDVELDVTSGGAAIDATISDGQFLIVSSGGLASGTIVGSGGIEEILRGGIARGAVVSSGGFEDTTGGIASGTVVSSGGVETIDFGTAYGTVVDSGGIEFIQADGITSGTIITSGGIQWVEMGGVASDTIVSSGGQEIVSGGAESGTHVLSGGTLVFSAGTVTIGGGQTVSGLDFNDAAAVRALVLPTITLDDGGTLIVSGMSQLDVASGGVAINETLGTGQPYEFPSMGPSMVVSSGGIASGTVVNVDGNEEIIGGTASGTVVNSGVLLVGGGVADATVVNAGGKEEFEGGVASGTTVNSGGTIQLELVPSFLNGGPFLSGSFVEEGTTIDLVVHSGGMIDFSFFTYADGGTATLDTSTDGLTVTEGGRTAVLQLAGDYTGEFFQLASDGIQGTLVTVNDTPACYCRGTRVLTDQGEAAVEDLRVGDHLITLSGAVRPIRWVGQRSYNGQFAATNRNILPVQFRPGALGDGVPQRDLFVSPQHAMFLDGMLVPAVVLVNGTSIVQVESVEVVEYFHLELETHDIILAEGAPSETFLDDGSRGIFHNAAEYEALYPDAASQPADYCVPRLEEGAALVAIRQRLAARYTVPAMPGSLRGHVDEVTRGLIRGWARDESGSPVVLQIIDHGVVLGQVVADAYRVDLEQAGIGDGRHSFTFAIPGGLAPTVPHVIEVCRVGDGQALVGSPWVFKVEVRRVA